MENEHTSPAPAPVDFTFHGNQSRSVDSKGRFNLPLPMRAPGELKYVVTDGPDGCLALWPYSVWLDNFNRARQGSPSPERRRHLRRMSLNSKIVEPDQQGRVAVTQEWLSRVGIDRKVTLVGVGRYMELWNPEDLTAIDDGSAMDDAAFVDDFYR